MSTQFQEYVRKQFPVQAVMITPLNIAELAEMCGATLMHDGEKEGNLSRDYFKVRVAYPISEEQTRGRAGKWLVKQGKNFKVYEDHSFNKTFETRGTQSLPTIHKKQKTHGRPKAQSPNPNQMPKRRTEQSTDVGDISNKSLEERSPEAAAAARADIPEVQAETIFEGVEITVDNVDQGPIEMLVERSKQYDRQIGETEEGWKARLQSQQVNPGAFTEADQAVEDAQKVENLHEEIEDSKPKPITLDQLNSQPGDTRTAEDMHRESLARPDQTPGEKYRGEA